MELKENMKLGKLTLINRFKDGKYWRWNCKCDCGNTTKSREYSLKTGTKSCGCSRKEVNSGCFKKKHGKRNTRIYSIWRNMRYRCTNKNNPVFKNYGGRGIKVCHEWNDFEVFYKWAMKNNYTEELTIDRIDNDGNYEPNNCKWSSYLEQSKNRRCSIKIVFKNKEFSLKEFSKETNIKYTTLRSRLEKVRIKGQHVYYYTELLIEGDEIDKN